LFITFYNISLIHRFYFRKLFKSKLEYRLNWSRITRYVINVINFYHLPSRSEHFMIFFSTRVWFVWSLLHIHCVVNRSLWSVICLFVVFTYLFLPFLILHMNQKILDHRRRTKLILTHDNNTPKSHVCLRITS